MRRATVAQRQAETYGISVSDSLPPARSADLDLGEPVRPLEPDIHPQIDGQVRDWGLVVHNEVADQIALDLDLRLQEHPKGRHVALRRLETANDETGGLAWLIRNLDLNIIVDCHDLGLEAGFDFVILQVFGLEFQLFAGSRRNLRDEGLDGLTVEREVQEAKRPEG